MSDAVMDLRPGAARNWGRIGLRVGPPIAVAMLANFVWWLAADRHGYNYFAAATWSRWDSLLYSDISQHGYNLFRCSEIHLYKPTDWCGNAGWYPGYPALMSVLEHLGMSPNAAGVTISLSFEVGLLLLLWNGFLFAQQATRRLTRPLLALVTAAFFFGQVYQRAIFPISMEIFFLLLTIWFANRRRWVWTGLAAAAASFTYSTGFVVIGALGLWLLVDPAIKPVREKVKAIAVSCGLGALGYLAVMVVQRVDVGVWGAFFKVQAKYGYSGLHLPTAKLHATLKPLFQSGITKHTVPALETLLVAIFCVGVVSIAAMYRRTLVSLDILVLCTTLAFWLFPLSIGADVHLYRSEALLLPGVLITRRLPIAVQTAMIAILVPLAYAMTFLFFDRTLV